MTGAPKFNLRYTGHILHGQLDYRGETTCDYWLALRAMVQERDTSLSSSSGGPDTRSYRGSRNIESSQCNSAITRLFDLPALSTLALYLTYVNGIVYRVFKFRLKECCQCQS